MKGKWIFPSTCGGEKQGLNNTGIEQFRDNPIRSLAREICQNSLDAARAYPVTVSFNTFELKKEEFPNHSDFFAILNSCREFKRDNKDAKDFFDKAIRLFEKDKISFLRISDFSTTGLNEDNWSKLVEESGESNKGTDKSGSFGIGKHAPFACSALRTVFYSSYDMDGVKRSKGVSRLTSHVIGMHDDGTEDISQGTGYYGVQEKHSINNFNTLLELDPDFKRHEFGTDVYVAGFDVDYDKSEILYSIESEIIDGFLMAIWENKLRIEINGRIIDKNSLTDDNVKREISSFLNKTTLLNLDLLADKNLAWENLNVDIGNVNIGSLKVAVQIKEEDVKGINNISMIRSSGMKIFDKANLCPLYRFTGLCIVEGEELNKKLRKLENASHNKWTPDRDNKAASQLLLNTIFDLLKQHLKKYASQEEIEEIDVAGASDYIPDVDSINGKKKKIIAIGFSKITDIKVNTYTKVESNSHLETNDPGEDIRGKVIDEGTIDETGNGYEARLKKGDNSSSGIKQPQSVGKNGDGNNNINQQRNVKSKQIRIFKINPREEREL